MQQRPHVLFLQSPGSLHIVAQQRLQNGQRTGLFNDLFHQPQQFPQPRQRLAAVDMAQRQLHQPGQHLALNLDATARRNVVQRIAKLRDIRRQRPRQRFNQIVKTRRRIPPWLTVVQHQRIDRRQMPRFSVLFAVFLPAGHDIAQQLQQHPVIRLALVFKQQINL